MINQQYEQQEINYWKLFGLIIIGLILLSAIGFFGYKGVTKVKFNWQNQTFWEGYSIGVLDGQKVMMLDQLNKSIVYVYDGTVIKVFQVLQAQELELNPTGENK